MDAITETRLKPMHPVIVRRYTRLDRALVERGILARITQGYRTWSEQAAIYAKGRTRPGEPCKHDGVMRPVGTCTTHPWGLRVTDAGPGHSWHNYALAIDVVPGTTDGHAVWIPEWDTKKECWQTLLSLAKTFGFAEGAAWRSMPGDYSHFYPEELPETPGDDVRQAFLDGPGPLAAWELYPQLDVAA